MGKYVVVIPARGGSKRVPGKNIMSVAGIPLLAHTILYAKEQLPDCEVYISTDSHDIANVAIQYQAQVIQRPQALSGDLEPTSSALQHAGREIIANGGDFDYMILLQATNPLRPKQMMGNALDIIETGQYDSLITVSPSLKKLGRIREHQFIPWNYHFGQRSQDMEPLYFENGLLYITRKDIILDGRIMGNAMYPMIVDHIYGTIDVDTQDDVMMVEFLMSKGQ